VERSDVQKAMQIIHGRARDSCPGLSYTEKKKQDQRKEYITKGFFLYSLCQLYLNKNYQSAQKDLVFGERSPKRLRELGHFWHD